MPSDLPTTRKSSHTEMRDLGRDGNDESPESSSSTGESFSKGWKLSLIIFSLCLGALLVALDNTIIAVAVPQIATTFKALDEVGWYGSGYLLTVTALQPTFGKIYKYFNVKLVYLISIILFEAGSTLCAAAPTSVCFILGRALAGIGAAGVFQGGLCVIGLSVPLKKRPLYIAIVVSTFGLATCFGPILGGVLTSKASWRWCFWINLPTGVFVFILVSVLLRLSSSHDADKSLPLKTKMSNLDPLGSTIFIAAVCCLLLALQWGGTKTSWTSSRIIGLLVGSVVLLILFGVLQWKLGDKGIIPLRVLRQRSVLMGCLYTFLLSVSNYTTGYYMPFYFQAVRGVSAEKSGIQFIPLAFPEVVAIVLTGVCINHTGHYVPYMILGSTVGAVGIGLLTTLNINTPTVKWASYLVLSGIGIGTGINIPFTAVQVALDKCDIPIGNAVTLFFMQLGGALSLPIANAAFVDGLRSALIKQTKAISPQAAIRAGPTNLRSLTDNKDVLFALRMSYLQAVKNSFYLALGAVASAVIFGACMEWRRMDLGETKRGSEIDTVNEQQDHV